MTALVLEGGAMRGMFTAGVTDVFVENGITFDAIFGVSAGAVFGCNIKSRQPGRAIRYNKRFCKDSRYGKLRSLIKTGDIYEPEFCYKDIPDNLDYFDRPAFAEDPTEFYIGATDVETGKAVYHKCSDGGDEDIEWMRASASMPLLSRPVNINGRLYLDGGIADPVPYKMAMRMGFDDIIVILTRPKGFRKKGLPALPFVRLALLTSPNLAKSLCNQHITYNKQMAVIDRLEEAGQITVIRPPEDLGISRTESDPNELERVYQIGRSMGELYRPRIVNS